MLGGLALSAGFATSLRAQTQPMQMAPTPTSAPAKPMTNAAPVAPVPPNSLGRYGKILAPGDDTEHPLKLKVPFPGVGEVKVPNQDELNVRMKLEQLANLSDADIRAQLEQWPAFSKMTLRDEGALLQRIQDFRDYRTRIALQKAHDMGLLTLTPDQKVRFEKDYWDKRLKLDQDLARQFTPIYVAREQKLQDELFREFSSASQGPMAQVPKPQVPPPVATMKAAVTTSAQPVAQAPQ
jgi:hypothetical protein